MTSKERVKLAINHKEADRVPVDIGGTKSTGISADEYIELGLRLGFDIELPKVFDQYQILARVEEPMRSWFRTDVIPLENYSEFCDMQNKDWKVWETAAKHKVLMPGQFNPEIDEKGYMYLRDKNGKLAAFKSPEALYFENYLKENVSSEDMMLPEEWKGSIPLYSDEELKVLAKRAKQLYENYQYAIIGAYGKLKMTTTGIFAGHTFTDWLCRLYTDPDYVYEILEATVERNIENLKLYFEAVGRYIDIVFVSTTDYGTQRREFFSPDIFKELYMPNLKKLNDFVHQNTDIKTMYHSCGSISGIIGYMIEAGIDIINPVQTTAENMDPVTLKEKFGKDIVFWGGGIDTQTVFQHGTPEEVEAQVKERIEIFGKGGGFVFTPVHNIQYEVPVENIIAMRNAVLKYGNY